MKPGLVWPQTSAPRTGSIHLGGEAVPSPFPLPTIAAASQVAEEIIPGEPDRFVGSARAMVAALLLRHWQDQADGFFE